MHLRIPNLKNTYANFLGQMCYKLETSIFQIMQQNFALILWANSYSKRQCIALVPVAVTNIAIGQHMQTHTRVWQERQRQKRAKEERTESLSEKDDTKREREWKKEIERQREREIKKENVREREWARKKERERETVAIDSHRLQSALVSQFNLNDKNCWKCFKALKGQINFEIWCRYHDRNIVSFAM